MPSRTSTVPSSPCGTRQLGTDSPGTAGCSPATARSRRHLAVSPGRYASVAVPLPAWAISGSPRRVAVLGRALTLPGVGAVLAAPWALTWNDLLDGAPLSGAAVTSRLALGIGH